MCRFPPNINLFSAMVGVGTQVLVIALCVFMLSLVGMFYPYNRGAMLSACVVLYALTAGISGEDEEAGKQAGSGSRSVVHAQRQVWAAAVQSWWGFERLRLGFTTTVWAGHSVTCACKHSAAHKERQLTRSAG